MDAIVFPKGEGLSSPHGEFNFPPWSVVIQPMATVEETRRLRLKMLVEKHGRMADLCEALGYSRKETAGLTRIVNANLRHDRDGEPYVMGSPKAREIEFSLKLEPGWMDTPPSYAEQHGEADPMAQAMAVLKHMPAYQWPKVLQMLDIFAQPEPKNGTND